MLRGQSKISLAVRLTWQQKGLVGSAFKNLGIVIEGIIRNMKL